jgi:hypothetical protein
MRAAPDDAVLEPLPVERVACDEWLMSRTGTAPRLPAPPRQSSATFTRLTTLHPALLAALPEWWSTRARNARVRAARGFDLADPQRERGGMWRLHGCLRSPWLRRPVGVELQLWPCLGAWTKITMQPRRRVRVGRRYYRVGHRALDALTARLERELPGVRPR